MSLNGLDSVEVTQAYQSALAEAGGWFLLRYTSRDAVQVLTRGTGGAGEARDALAQYDEKSPLYGLLLYRRRKVLLKYVPEGTSRLLQARVSVHFITVTERFAPHDTILSISSPEELSDAALASACTLHTAAPSSSSSSGSSRPQKLSWIQETAEEGGNPNGEDSAHALRPATTVSVIPTILEPTTSNEDEPLRSGSIISQAETVPLILEEKVVESVLAPDVSRSTIETFQEPATPESDLTELQATLRSYDQLFEGGPEPRLSSQTARPNYNELYEHYYAQYTKPKVKLGPRPRQSLEGQRPSTSGSSSQDVARPVSSLPSGIRPASRKKAQKKESKTRMSSAIPAIAIPPPLPLPMTPEMPRSPVSPAYSSWATASVKSLPVSSAYSSHHRSTGMTQEKTRLMKALELRKKQQQARDAQKERAAENVVEISNVDSENKPQASNTESPKQPSTDQPAAADGGDTPVAAQHEEEPSMKQESSSADDESSLLGLDSSGLVFASDQTETDDMNSTASVCSPVSAQTQGSSGAPSTRPSSISEDENAYSEGKEKPGSTLDNQTTDLLDEEQSVDSATTVKPECQTPIPSVETEGEISRRTITAHDIPSFDASVQFERTNMEGLSMPTEDNDAQSRRRSKRESTMYIPSGDSFMQGEVETSQGNIESVHMPTSKRQSWYESKERRRAMLDPLQVSAENSETEYLSDDSFMEELQSATVHQAKPMSVSKSPMSPFFPRKASATEVTITTPPRTASQVYQSIEHPSPETGRKSSGAWPPRAKTDTVVTAKKINVSSGISQRIKALAEKSNKDRSSAPVTPANGLDTSSSTLAQRKSSFFATTPVETSPNSRPTTRLGSPSFLAATTSTTPEKKKQPGPIKSTVYNVQREAEKPESVQVTARIVRDDRTKQPTLAMPTETTPLDLHQSPLIIDHQKPLYSPKSPTRGRPEPASPRTTSSSHSREQSIAPSRTSSESTWRPFSRRMSESKSIHSHEGEEKREEKKDKKESRTSKMFKRMSSSISSMPWKNSSNNLSLPEHSMTSTSLSSVFEPPPPVHLGDLNIQFPDTLLWKRRWAEIDTMGNIVLSPSKSNEKGMIKRYHLTEFRTPYPPDQDRQELPNSVVLDFVDGRTLQCACETYSAQVQVLQILREAHDVWLAHSQAS